MDAKEKGPVIVQVCGDKFSMLRLGFFAGTLLSMVTSLLLICILYFTQDSRFLLPQLSSVQFARNYSSNVP
jgi:hypothetical protein